MLAVQTSSKGAPKCTPNLLPARLNYNGPINDTDRYWKPEKTEDGKSHAYFRGRHLHGTSLSLPLNYTGAVLHVTEKDLPAPSNGQMEIEDDDEAEKVEVKVAEQIGKFDEVMVWGHGSAIDTSEDVYAKGVNEWIGFAEAMHIEPREEEGKQGKT